LFCPQSCNQLDKQKATLNESRGALHADGLGIDAIPGLLPQSLSSITNRVKD
jgi:hypothetical protein